MHAGVCYMHCLRLICGTLLIQIQMKRIAVPESLVRYQPAIEIYESMKAYHREKYKEESGDTAPKPEEIIDSIIPPRDWTDHLNKLHIQYASHQHASREDVMELSENLEKMLEDRQAKKNGICGIREELYSQAFDEIIRQIAVDCPERGLLLMRVRDEHKMTLAAYETVYQSSLGYGMKKQVESEQGSEYLQKQIEALEARKAELDHKKGLLLDKKQLAEKEQKQQRALQAEKRQQELNFLKLQKENMVKFLESVRVEFTMME